MLLADLDESIRQLLIRDVPLDPTEVDVSFDAPDREWSGRLSRPTLNCFLYDLRENHDLRQNDWELNRTNGSQQKRKPPLRIDVSYQVSAWARAAEDEHQLLWRALVVLVKHPVLPGDVLQGGLKGQPLPVPAKVGQPEQAPRNPADLWQALDNRVRPSVAYVVTLALDPDVQVVAPLVFTSVTRLQQYGGQGRREQLQIAGTVRAKEDGQAPVAGLTVRIMETGDAAVTDGAGRFVFSHAPRGMITLVVKAAGTDVVHRFDVPALSYDLAV